MFVLQLEHSSVISRAYEFGFLFQQAHLGPTVGAVLMRTTCVGGAPRICDTRVIRGVVHHTAVVRVPRERLCRSQEEAVQGRVAAP